MEVYLVKKEDNSIVQTIYNVVNFGENFVETAIYNTKTKEYCPDDCYFTDIKPEEIEEQVESDAWLKIK